MLMWMVLLLGKRTNQLGTVVDRLAALSPPDTVLCRVCHGLCTMPCSDVFIVGGEQGGRGVRRDFCSFWEI